MPSLTIAQDPTADRVLSEDPFALLTGMLLDQQFPMERAFAGPAKVLERFGEVQEEYDHLGGYALEAKTREILHGLGFDDERIDGDVGALSGGWKMRVAMARVLLGELDGLRTAGVDVSGLKLSANAHLIMPYHVILDHSGEAKLGRQEIGTTKRGIGPAYEDKVGRRAIRVQDLAEPDALPMRVERLLAHHNALRRGLRLEEIDPAALLAEVVEAAVARVLPARREAAQRVGGGRQGPGRFGRRAGVGLKKRLPGAAAGQQRQCQQPARSRPAAPARLAGTGSVDTVPRIRLRVGSTRWPSNQPPSAGWCSSMGCRVVGLMAPERVTGCPTRALTSVDLPAPVEPPTTASSGASRLRYRGRM